MRLANELLDGTHIVANVLDCPCTVVSVWVCNDTITIVTVLVLAIWVTVAVGENVIGTRAPEDIVIVVIPDAGVGVELSERLLKNPDDFGLSGCAELC